MPIIIDASATAGFLIPDEKSSQSEKLFSQLHKIEIFVPNLWEYEVRNMLLISLRRKRLSFQQFDIANHIIGQLPVHVKSDPDFSSIMHYARKYDLSFYDGVYMELTMRENAKLVTFDKKLKKAAELENCLFWL
jgi:predicted nucleic acid-binding protein